MTPKDILQLEKYSKISAIIFGTKGLGAHQKEMFCLHRQYIVPSKGPNLYDGLAYDCETSTQMNHMKTDTLRVHYCIYLDDAM